MNNQQQAEDRQLAQIMVFLLELRIEREMKSGAPRWPVVFQLIGQKNEIMEPFKTIPEDVCTA